MTPTHTPTTTPTLTKTQTSTLTTSTTGTATNTQTTSPTSSSTATATPSQSRTPSMSVTLTPSTTPSGTTTNTKETSETSTPSPTRATKVPTTTPTLSPSPSPTTSMSPKTTLTPTGSITRSVTRTTTDSATATTTVTPSPTPSKTDSVSKTGSFTQSVSQTITVVPTFTSSSTPTHTATRSVTHSSMSSLFVPCVYPCSIVVAFDESSASSPQDFQFGVRFLKDFLNRLGTAEKFGKLRIGIVSIAKQAQVESQLLSDYRALMGIVNTLKQREGPRNIDDSINLATLMLNSAAGDNVECGAIMLLAFGGANNLAFAVNSANVAMSLNYRIVTVTVGKEMSDNEINAYSEPSYQYRTASGSDLLDLSPKLAPCGTSCGNGFVNIGETCDTSDYGTLSCASFGFQGGSLTCSNCQTNTSRCNGVACGNGVLQQGEQCDGVSFGSATCPSLGFGNGTLRCLPNCTISTSACEPIVCGNGVKQGAEQCDGSDLGNATCTSVNQASGVLHCTPSCSLNTSLCLGSCGNSIIEGIEQCDTFNLNNFSCTNFGFNGGILRCSTSCEYSTSQCISNAQGCGNGILEVGELCDTFQFGSVTCAQFGLSGPLTCTSNCQISISSCFAASVCGNGVVNDGEQCDQQLLPSSCSALGFSSGLLKCSSTCQFVTASCIPFCGNGVVNTGEACDGSLVPAQCIDLGFNGGVLTCGPTCQLVVDGCTTACGNGIVDGNEACDVFNLTLNTCSTLGYSSGQLTCNSLCQYNTSACSGPRVCGNGVIEGQERCDDQNVVNGDGCDAQCNVENAYTCSSPGGTGKSLCARKIGCGDGIMEPGEQCDDRNVVSNDGCSSMCTIERGYTCKGIPSKCTVTGILCGDGIVLGNEQCDDRNTVSGDGCSASCVIEFGFTCSLTAAQASNCTRLAICGNSILDSGEQCDKQTFGGVTCATLEGFVNGTLLCTNQCTIDTRQCVPKNICGNGFLEGGEQCDTEDFGGLSCIALLLGSGTLTCDPSCNILRTSCVPDQVCGNQIIEGDENCDSRSFAAKTCSSFPGLTDGILLCSSTCSISTAGCRGSLTCGNGMVNTNEQCDDGNVNDGDGCSSKCFVESGYQCTSPISSSQSICVIDRCSCETIFLFTESSNSLDVEFAVLNGFVTRYGNSTIFSKGGRVGIVSYTGAPRIIVGLSDAVDPVVAAANAFLEQSNPTSDIGAGLVRAGRTIQTDGILPCMDVILFVEKNSTNSMRAAVVSSFLEDYGIVVKVVNVRASARRAEFQPLSSPNEYYEVQSPAPTTIDTLVSRLFPCDICGDGRLGGSEECEQNIITATCSSFSGLAGGVLKCNKCKFDRSSCIPAATCGNGVLEIGEQCDGSFLGDRTCASLGFSGGALSCVNCLYNSQLCTTLKCGDGAVQGSEQCDDGNANSGDGCSSKCAIEEGFSCFNSPVFPTSCTRSPTGVCGDRGRSPSEQCDTNDLNSQTCISLGYASGVLSCTNNCTFDGKGCRPLNQNKECCANAECTKPILSLLQCNDGNSATLNDVCIAGVCKGQFVCNTICLPNTACEDSSRCIDGLCYPVFRSDFSDCGNGNVCYKGICTSTAAASSSSVLDSSLNVDFTNAFKLYLVAPFSRSPQAQPIFPSPKSGSGTTIGIVLGIAGGVLLLVLLIALLYYMCMRPPTVSFQPIKDVMYSEEYYQASEGYPEYQDLVYPTYAQEFIDEPQFTYDPVAFDGNYASATYGVYGSTVEGYGAE